MKRKPILSGIFLLLTAILILGNGDCGPGTPTQKSESGVDQIKEMYKVPVNSQGKSVEQQNIEDRLRVTTDFTKILWIHILSLDGKIINRMIVRNKVTSSGKRLEPVIAGSSNEYGNDMPKYKSFETPEIIQPDGTFGSSDSYIFWFDAQGRYHQLGTSGSLGYLLTDYPIDLKNPLDEVTGMYRAELTALEFQKKQEEILRKQNPNKQ